MANKMEPDCLCKKKRSEKISADKMYPSLNPILLRGGHWWRILSLFMICIFFICRILYFFCAGIYIFSSSDKMYPSLYPIHLRKERNGGEFYLFLNFVWSFYLRNFIFFICGILYLYMLNFIFFICGKNVSFFISYPLEREPWWRNLSHFYAWPSIWW